MPLTDLITPEILVAVEKEDEPTLIKLDQNGLICGEQDNGPQFAAKLQELLKETQEFEKDLQKEGREIDGLQCTRDVQIPAQIFDECQDETKQLFAFSIDWVPGFFITPKFALLFAGCAYSSDKSSFSVFIITRKFRQQMKWFMYNRKELMSHELCHVARTNLQAHKYEEYFAYHTSTTKFRRNFGSMVRSSLETFLLLGLCFGLIPIQILENLGHFGMTSLWTSPFTYGISACLGYLTFLVLRQTLMIKKLNRLKEKLSPISSDPQAFLFRCSDNEIDQLLKTKKITKETALATIQSSVRKTVIAKILLK